MEVWKDILGYETKYQISDLGRVRSLYHKHGDRHEPKILKQWPNNRGYYTVTLCKNSITKTYLVHRLVGVAFLENAEDKPTIDHRDKDLSNNQVSNLQWATHDEQLYNKQQPITINGVIGKSGEKYIHYMPKLSKYRVYNKRHSPVLEYFDTLTEAVKFRDEYLKTISPS
jgi:hypothetical protein